MTNNQLTRERLEKIKSWRETYGAGSNVMLPAEEAEELARIALAAMDSEPVFFIEVEGDDWTNAGRIEGKNRPDLGLLPDGINYLYAAPQPLTQVKAVADLYALCWQPGDVVTFTPEPEKAAIWLNNYSGTCVQEYVKLERLQEAVMGNSPVIPDRWIPVSERMPEERETVVLVADERGIVWCAEIQDGEIYPDEFPGTRGFGCAEATHWMPLPAAPKQEDI